MIVVFGSLNVDLVVPVRELPRAGETVVGEGYSLVAGGKGGNQALAAARDGARVAMVGAVGRDDFADVALRELSLAGVDLTRVRRVDAPTGCATIAVDTQGENQIVVAGGANLAVEAGDLPDALLTPDTTLVLQMELRAEVITAVIARATARGARVILNLAPATWLERATFGQIDILVVNEHESRAIKLTHRVDGRAQGMARALGCNLALTLGEDGATGVFSGQRIHVPTLKITPVDSTAAGDTFVGVLAAALDRGMAPREALRRASVAGALACLKPGAQPSIPTRAEIDARLGELPP